MDSPSDKNPSRTTVTAAEHPAWTVTSACSPQLGYVVTILSNQDPPAASSLANFFTRRMPAQ
jgi:hypothetical protein